ncbi:hypothetical protein [Mycolicibacterium sp. A43C]
MLQNMIRRMQARVMVVAADDSGMSTVEYAMFELYTLGAYRRLRGTTRIDRRTTVKGYRLHH